NRSRPGRAPKCQGAISDREGHLLDTAIRIDIRDAGEIVVGVVVSLAAVDQDRRPQHAPADRALVGLDLGDDRLMGKIAMSFIIPDGNAKLNSCVASTSCASRFLTLTASP